MLGLIVLIAVAVGAMLSAAVIVGARRDITWVKPAVIGAVVGGSMVLAGVWAKDALDDFGWDVTPEEVQIAAINAWLAESPLPQGEPVQATVHYGGQSCGGVVELTTTGNEPRLFVVGHDSGAPIASPFDGTLSEAMDELRNHGYDCPDL